MTLYALTCEDTGKRWEFTATPETLAGALLRLSGPCDLSDTLARTMADAITRRPTEPAAYGPCLLLVAL